MPGQICNKENHREQQMPKACINCPVTPVLKFHWFLLGFSMDYCFCFVLLLYKIYCNHRAVIIRTCSCQNLSNFVIFDVMSYFSYSPDALSLKSADRRPPCTAPAIQCPSHDETVDDLFPVRSSAYCRLVYPRSRDRQRLLIDPCCLIYLQYQRSQT